MHQRLITQKVVSCLAGCVTCIVLSSYSKPDTISPLFPYFYFGFLLSSGIFPVETVRVCGSCAICRAMSERLGRICTMAISAAAFPLFPPSAILFPYLLFRAGLLLVRRWVHNEHYI
jgi:hypothetical protein